LAGCGAELGRAAPGWSTRYWHSCPSGGFGPMKKIILLAFIAIVIGAAAYLGVINPKKVEAQARGALYSAKGIAGDLGSAPSGPSQSAQQSAAACRENLKRIESAKRALASRQGVTVGAISWDAIKKELGGQIPKCAGGGSYSINSLEMLPTCSIGGAGTV